MSHSRAGDVFEPLDSQRVSSLILEARQGSLEAQGRLLDAYRQDLLATAQAHLDSGIRSKLGASDMVQESLLEAHRDFHTFRGNSGNEVRAWLKRILLNNLVNQYRYWRSQKRSVCREVHTNGVAHAHLKQLADDGPSSSGVVSAREQQAAFDTALARLKPEYRQVLELRHRDVLPFAEIGVLMNRSADSARMLWGRAFDQLSRELTASGAVEV